MLFWLSLVALIGGGLSVVVSKISCCSGKHGVCNFFNSRYFAFSFFGTVAMLIGGLAASISLVFMLNSDDLITRLNDKYNVVMTELESDAFKDELSTNNLDILHDVENWNKTVVNYQELKNNLLVYNLYPDEINDLKTIEYEKYFK